MADLTPERFAALQTDLAEAQGIARILAHAYEHDSRPPADAVKTALAYPVRTRDTAKRGDQHERHDRCFDTAKAVGIDLLKQNGRLLAALRECRDYFAEEGFDKYSPGAHPMSTLFHQADALLRDLDAETQGGG